MFNTQVNFDNPLSLLIKSMDIAKARNSASFVNYVKPGIEMLEMEIEGSLLLTASGDPGSVRFGGSVSGAGGNAVPGASNGGKWSSTTGTAAGGTGFQSVRSGGKHSF
jgi:hypothetical protein